MNQCVLRVKGGRQAEIPRPCAHVLVVKHNKPAARNRISGVGSLIHGNTIRIVFFRKCLNVVAEFYRIFLVGAVPMEETDMAFQNLYHFLFSQITAVVARFAYRIEHQARHLFHRQSGRQVPCPLLRRQPPVLIGFQLAVSVQILERIGKGAVPDLQQPHAGVQPEAEPGSAIGVFHSIYPHFGDIGGGVSQSHCDPLLFWLFHFTMVQFRKLCNPSTKTCKRFNSAQR